jgi:multidrug efflux pump
MNVLTTFIRRPVATSLLTLAIALPGLLAFKYLPRAALPQVDYPTINVAANLPGASPETMAATVATPLERAFGRIAGIEEMTSTSTQGSTRINLQFELDRNIDGAARDVQAAINAARALLPRNIPSNPSYRRINASAAPILAISLTSPTHTKEQLYDYAFSILGQKISQVRGVGQVSINGSALRSVRVEVNPNALNQYGISLEQLRTAIAASNQNRPKGQVQSASSAWQIEVNDQAKRAVDYQNLIVAYRGQSPIRLSQVALVRDSVQEVRNAGSANGKPTVMLVVLSQPGANVIETVDAIRAMLPALKTLIPQSIDLEVIIDRSTTVRKSISEVQHTLYISIALVILVTFIFLRNGRATLIPSIAIPVSLLGTLAVIYLLGYSLNNLSLMALIISASFVVDDAIVVVENTIQHLEHGESPFEAAIKGMQEVGFTVLAMSVSLVAVFVPLLFMDGILGRLFREFAVTLSVAVMISLLVSLTATPMLCAQFLKTPEDKPPSRWARAVAKIVDAPFVFYRWTLGWTLRHGWLMLMLLLGVIVLNVHLYKTVPKGFFPQQDTGRLQGSFQGDQSLSFAEIRKRIDRLMKIVSEDPDIKTYYEYTGGAGGGQTNTGTMFASLRPLPERETTAAEVVARLRPQLMKVPGVSLMLTSQQELSIGARQGGAQFQYTLLADDLPTLEKITPKLRGMMNRLPELTDVNTDFQTQGLQLQLQVDRNAAAQLGITAAQLDATLNNAFSQRLISTIYEPLNQYYMVLTLSPEFTKGPQALEQLYLNGLNNTRVPLSAISHWQLKSTPLAVNHQGQFVAATISFNVAEGYSLEQATSAIEQAFERSGAPDNVNATFSGAAKMFKASLASQPWLILAGLLTVYIVLGILYESFIHPLTILSTLPSAGIGALLALILFDTEFSIIALIGVILLTGIVMKNAIMLIDCALQLERHGYAPYESIKQACLLRFRPILMTTLAAMLGALPLALGSGDGAEIRQPLGISVVGGLVFSQLLTLYTTPAVYLALDRMRHAFMRRFQHNPTLHFTQA